MLRRHFVLSLSLAALSAVLPSVAAAEDAPVIEVSIKGTTFTPAEIKAPADKPFVIKLKNENAAPVELESKDLKIEKVAAGNSEIVVKVRPIGAGKYLFVDEFQEDVAKGFVVVE